MANTTSTYSSCSRSRDAFRPAAQTGLSGVLGPVLPAARQTVRYSLAPGPAAPGECPHPYPYLL